MGTVIDRQELEFWRKPSPPRPSALARLGRGAAVGAAVIGSLALLPFIIVAGVLAGFMAPTPEARHN